MYRMGLMATAVLAVLGGTASAGQNLILEARLSCKQMTNCRDAVILWCNGYHRADGDNDGIPCENVCRSLREVNEIRAEIGC
ncbi:excalibur calcium-binding domain-containing protein [Hoeflea olei]|uniref:Uncharacterized protein n=1 Tax=Hoeflea olei TaxID=1480615 RepID=A0A1C1YVH3_9HYPH|nr:excalibur calcium-binding domain-containing protein [Hoeflea olei]OCW57485.1 hypothetical protein AWJ14_14135 [Hoeflea olei]